jgi:hypothetical protein
MIGDMAWVLAKAVPITFQPITHFPQQGDLLSWCREMGPGTAVLLGLLGIIYLMYGWSLYRWLIMLNAAAIGAYVGAVIGAKNQSVVVGGIMGGVVAAAMAYPLLKWAVAVIGGVVGAFVGAGLWKIAGQDTGYAWAGAMTGLVGFGMLAFIVFRGSIMLYTSAQGALMLLVGLLGLAFKYPDLAQKVAGGLNGKPNAIPVLTLIGVVAGIWYQRTHLKPVSAPSGGGGEKEKKKDD